MCNGAQPHVTSGPTAACGDSSPFNTMHGCFCRGCTHDNLYDRNGLCVSYQIPSCNRQWPRSKCYDLVELGAFFSSSRSVLGVGLHMGCEYEYGAYVILAIVFVSAVYAYLLHVLRLWWGEGISHVKGGMQTVKVCIVLALALFSVCFTLYYNIAIFYVTYLY